MTRQQALDLARQWAKRRIPAGPIAISWDERKQATNKVPLTPHGHNSFVTDLNRLDQLFGSSQMTLAAGEVYGVGLHPGPGHRVVLDVDTKGGKQGDKVLAALEAEHGPLPPHPIVDTASGGTHRWLAKPEGVPVGNPDLADHPGPRRRRLGRRPRHLHTLGIVDRPRRHRNPRPAMARLDSPPAQRPQDRRQRPRHRTLAETRPGQTPPARPRRPPSPRSPRRARPGPRPQRRDPRHQARQESRRVRQHRPHRPRRRQSIHRRLGAAAERERLRRRRARGAHRHGRPKPCG
jgi:Bifunctional DNA primase/polymerase, N-terminal